MKNILEALESTAQKHGDKVAFSDDSAQLTFAETCDNSKRIGTFLLQHCGDEKAVALFIDRSCRCIEAMLGAVYAGKFYVVIDVNSPDARIQSILETLKEAIILTDKKSYEIAERNSGNNQVLFLEDALQTSIDQTELDMVRSAMTDQDPVYVLFTSGSTGQPKGTVISHNSLISYINWVSKEFDFDTNTVFGAQTPLYFSMSVTDFYSTIMSGCTYHIIPKHLFMFPLNLIEFLNEKKINTIYWVPTAISVISNWNAFDFEKPSCLNRVLFAGEVMPTKQLNYWIKKLAPNNEIVFANLFGPTETTDICTFYKVDREFADDENLPIGKHCDNCDVFVVKENGEKASVGEEGELYVRGSFVANGYYNNPEKTQAAFVQNPLNTSYPETVYKTGDLVRFNEKGELLYISRKDFQVKRSGYRIELGEIEAGANSIDKVKACVCIYNKSTDCLMLFYEGGPKDTSVVLEALRKKIPAYMIPDKIIRIQELPKNANGKIDRIALSKQTMETK